MALSLLVTASDGGTIEAGTWNAEFNNIYNNSLSLISPLTGTLDLAGKTLSGGATFSGDMTFSDNVKATFGTGGDADIYYDGTNLVINPEVVGSGHCLFPDDAAIALGTGGDALIYYDGTNLVVNPEAVGSGHCLFPDNAAIALGTGGDALLYYDGTNLIVNPEAVGSGHCLFPDNAAIALGTGGDALLYYDGTNLIINPEAVGSGHCLLPDSAALALGTGGDALLYYDGTNLTIDPKAVGSGHCLFPDSAAIALGTGGDSLLYYDGTNTYIEPRNVGTGNLIVNDQCIFFVNDTANSNMTVGLTINMEGNDNQAQAWKTSDCAHGITTVVETDTYGDIRKADVSGGLDISGYVPASSGNVALQLSGVVGDTAANTTKSTAGLAPVVIKGWVRSGTNRASPGSNENLVAVRSGNTTRFLLDAEGDSHQDVGTAWTNFDDQDDIEIMNAMAVAIARPGDPLRDEFLAHFEEKRSILENLPGKAIVKFNDDGHHFANMSRVTMLHHGAIRQMAHRQDALEQKLLALEAK